MTEHTNEQDYLWIKRGVFLLEVVVTVNSLPGPETNILWGPNEPPIPEDINRNMGQHSCL